MIRTYVTRGSPISVRAGARIRRHTFPVHTRLHAHRYTKFPLGIRRVTIATFLDRSLLHQYLSLQYLLELYLIFRTSWGHIETPSVFFNLVRLFLRHSYCCRVTENKSKVSIQQIQTIIFATEYGRGLYYILVLLKLLST